jgi:formamidopyrimidine-DNA glycosylase
MIELPEAVTIARQINATLSGKRIIEGVANSSPHKFAFYYGEPEAYAEAIRDRTIGGAEADGNMIHVSLDPEYRLVLGEGGERILYHPTAKTLPKKHQLKAQFADGTYLTVTVSGWGALWLLPVTEPIPHRPENYDTTSPLSDDFTFDRFNGHFDTAQEAGSSKSIKYFIVSEPGVWGVSNGYLQDILFRAGIHPRRKVVDVTQEERRKLYDAVLTTLEQAINQGGRDTERDLFNDWGGYRPLMDRKTKGEPCPTCGTPIEKISYLGGSCYLCPSCQK